MQPASACVGFMSTWSALISSLVLPSLAKNSATQTTWVVFLFGILASLFHRFEGVIEIEGFSGRLVSVHHGAHRLDHRLGRFALEDVAPHIDSRRAFTYRTVAHGKRFEFGKLLPAGDDQRHGAAGSHARKPWLTVVRLHKMCAKFRAHPRSEA